jgi:hypothetical protein
MARRTIAHTPAKVPLPFGFNSPARAFAYRWFSGRSLNGHRYSDATYFRYGTLATDLSGRTSTYHLLPGYKRFAYFRAPLMAAPLEAALLALPDHALGNWTDPRFHYTAMGGGALLLADRLNSYRRTRVFRRDVVEPVAAGAAAVLRMAHVKGKGHGWVYVPADFRDNDDSRIKIKLPLEWVGDDGDKKRLAEVVRARLSLPDVAPSWHLSGAEPFVSFTVPPQPPSLVSFEEAREDMETSSDIAPLMGYGARGALVTFSLTLESPHLLIAGGTGAGKSELLAAIVGQFLRKGYGCVVLDAKFTSHMWLRKVAGVSYNSEDEDLHNALVYLDRELLRRARFVASGGDPAELIPMIVLMEEMPGASNRLRAYWRRVKASGDPMMSPALTALGNLSSMGRELRMHILMAGQSMTAKAVGGPENRENFGGRAFARATAAQWRMLAPQIKPAPVKRGEPGRWHLVVGDVLREFQAPFMDIKDEAERLIAWATGGNPIPDMVAMMNNNLMPQDPWSRALSSDDEPTVELAGVITLRNYVEQRPGLTMIQLRNWQARHPEGFPERQGMAASAGRPAALYVESALDDYVTHRLGQAEPAPVE